MSLYISESMIYFCLVPYISTRFPVFPPNFLTLGSQVRRQKQEAVAREDYDRAMELKELEKQLENQRQRPTKMARSETVNQ